MQSTDWLRFTYLCHISQWINVTYWMVLCSSSYLVGLSGEEWALYDLHMFSYLGKESPSTLWQNSDGPQPTEHFKASLNYKQGLLYSSPFVFLVQRSLQMISSKKSHLIIMLTSNTSSSLTSNLVNIWFSAFLIFDHFLMSSALHPQTDTELHPVNTW